MPGADDRRVLIAEIGSAHGIRGEVRLRAFTDDAEALTGYGPLQTEDRAKLVIRRLRQTKNGLIAEIEGVTTRNAAEALRHTRLYVDRAALPDTGEDEWYHVDLVGLDARTPAGEKLGTVVAVQDFGAGDLLELRLKTAGGTIFVPFTRAVVPEVDVAAGFVVIDPPAGLLDEPDQHDDWERGR